MARFPVQSGQLFLLAGDSITDCDRRGNHAPYGHGYMSLFRELVIARHPERQIRWLNRGISGDTVLELKDRWQDDVIAEQPHWLSILVGINDLGHHIVQKPTMVSAELYARTYRELLERTRRETKARVVLLEPFLLSHETDRETVRGKMCQLLPEYLKAVRALAREFKTWYVPLQKTFETQRKHRSYHEFGPEPVHPARPGHVVIAQALYDGLCAGPIR